MEISRLIINYFVNNLIFKFRKRKGTSVLELLEMFQEVNKCIVPYQIKQKRIGDVAFAVANNEKATSLLKWFPKRTLEQCCIDGWNWQKKNPLGYQ